MRVVRVICGCTRDGSGLGTASGHRVGAARVLFGGSLRDRRARTLPFGPHRMATRAEDLHARRTGHRLDRRRDCAFLAPVLMNDRGAVVDIQHPAVRSRSRHDPDRGCVRRPRSSGAQRHHALHRRQPTPPRSWIRPGGSSRLAAGRSIAHRNATGATFGCTGGVGQALRGPRPAEQERPPGRPGPFRRPYGRYEGDRKSHPLASCVHAVVART